MRDNTLKPQRYLVGTIPYFVCGSNLRKVPERIGLPAKVLEHDGVLRFRVLPAALDFLVARTLNRFAYVSWQVLKLSVTELSGGSATTPQTARGCFTQASQL